MHALIPDVAVAGVPEPVPVVGEPVPCVGAHWRGSEEEIPVEARRHWRGRRVPDRLPAAKAKAAGHVDLADGAFAQHLHCKALVADRAALRADLHHPPVLAGRLDHPVSLEHVVAGGLLHVHVLAGLTGPDRRESMPVIGCRHGNRLDVPVLEQLAHVRILLRRVSLCLADDGRGALPRLLIHVADRRQARIRDIREIAQVAAAPAPHPDHGQMHRVIGSQHRKAAGRDRGGRSCQEASATWIRHGVQTTTAARSACCDTFG